MVSNLKEKLDWAACSRLHSSMPSVIDLSSGYTKGGVVALYSFQGLDLTRQGSRKQRKGNSTNFLFCLPRLTAVFQSRTKFCKPQSYYTKRHNQREKIAFRIPNESSCFEQELVTAVNVKASKLLYQQWETCSNIYFMFYLSPSLPPLSCVCMCEGNGASNFKWAKNELTLVILFFPSLKFWDYRHELYTWFMWCWSSRQALYKLNRIPSLVLTF